MRRWQYKPSEDKFALPRIAPGVPTNLLPIGVGFWLTTFLGKLTGKRFGTVIHFTGWTGCYSSFSFWLPLHMQTVTLVCKASVRYKYFIPFFESQNGKCLCRVEWTGEDCGTSYREVLGGVYIAHSVLAICLETCVFITCIILITLTLIWKPQYELTQKLSVWSFAVGSFRK